MSYMQHEWEVELCNALLDAALVVACIVIVTHEQSVQDGEGFEARGLVVIDAQLEHHAQYYACEHVSLCIEIE